MMLDYSNVNQDEICMKYRPKPKAVTIEDLLDDYMYAVLGPIKPPGIEKIRKIIKDMR
jgi:hypothetical protein